MQHHVVESFTFIASIHIWFIEPCVWSEESHSCKQQVRKKKKVQSCVVPKIETSARTLG